MIPFLRSESLVKRYNQRTVVDRLSFSIGEAEIVALLGANGAGKTTAFHMAMGLISPDEGKLFFKEEEITRLPIYQRGKRGMGYLSQEPSVFRSMSVRNNILAILENQPLTRWEREERLEELLETFHLQKLSKKIAATLSGGERRRLEIARSLVTNPSLLLLDEPFANVDPLTIQQLKELLNRLVNSGISIFITDHNAKEVLSFAHRCYLMHEGKMIACGQTEEIIASSKAQKYYLGTNFVL